jgi:hypothetical protein
MLKEQPYVDHLIKGGTLREYQAHILSDGGRVNPKNLYGNGVLLCGEAGGITATITGMGIPTCILSGMMAAKTIADAVEMNDFSKDSLKNYLKYLDTTALLGMIHQSREESDCFAGENRADGAREMEAAAKIYNRYWESDVQYLSKPAFWLPMQLYLDIGQYRLPGWLRWPLTALIRLGLLPKKVVQAMKKRMRTRYYEWKQ